MINSRRLATICSEANMLQLPGLVKNSLKSDYPPPEVALTPIFASHREFF